MPRFPVLLAASLLLTSTAYGACPLNVHFTATPPTLSWSSDSAVKSYEIQESFDEGKTSRNYFVTSNVFPILRRVSAAMKVSYTVTALLEANVSSLPLNTYSQACTESLTVPLKPDASFRALTRRGIIPIVGSGPGANGGKFKTSIRLTSTEGQQRGMLVFHPAGRAAAPNDPSMRYTFDGVGETLAIDDVVATLGASGVGSLDVIPDEGASNTLPSIDIRLFNDTPSGTFGTSTNAFAPFDFLQAPALTFAIPEADQPFRINAGIRTLTATSAKYLIYGTNGRLRDFGDLFWPADFTALGSVQQFLGTTVAPGESVTIFFSGSAIPFYTRTENRTNDPEVFVPVNVAAANVGAYVE